MSKTIDKKIKELSKKHSTDEKVKYDCTAWDEGQVCCTEKDWFKSWLQQALSEVERESYERGYLAGQDKLVKNLKIHLMPYELKGRT